MPYFTLLYPYLHILKRNSSKERSPYYKPNKNIENLTPLFDHNGHRRSNVLSDREEMKRHWREKQLLILQKLHSFITFFAFDNFLWWLNGLAEEKANNRKLTFHNTLNSFHKNDSLFISQPPSTKKKRKNFSIVIFPYVEPRETTKWLEITAVWDSK